MLKKILIGIALNGIALFAVSYFLSANFHYTGGIKFFIIGGLIIGILNTFVKPLMKILSFPLVITTVGLFLLVINAIIFWLTMKAINVIHISDVTADVTGVSTYLIAALVFGIINWILHIIFHAKK